MSLTHRLATAGAVAALGLAAAAPAASASNATDAANWLQSQLVSGNHLVTYTSATSSYDDVGLTLDGVFGFAATNPSTTAPGYGARIDAMLDWASQPAQLTNYLGNGTVTNAATCATSAELYSGALAKVATALVSDGRSTTSVGSGGRNVLAQLKCRQQSNGRFTDNSSFGDYSNAFGQSFAIMALRRAQPTYTNPNGSRLSTAVSFLKAQQCSAPAGSPNVPQNGAFRVGFGGAASACTAPTGTGDSAANVDATAMAAQALYDSGETAAADDATRWIASQQVPPAGTPAADRGAWRSPACTGTPAANVNTTGLAVAGLKPRTTTSPAAAISRAQTWLGSVQHVTGGVRDWLPGCSAPDPQVNNSRNVRATTQGLLGLTGKSYLDLL